MSVASLTALPDEILASIALYLDITSLVALNLTAKRFRNLIDEPLIWRNVCHHDFRYWNDKRQFRASLTDPLSHDWKAIAVNRVKVSRSVRQCIQELIDDPVGRSDRVQAIVDQGYISKDALLHAFNADSNAENYLAQRYWSHVALGCLHRSTAVKEWDRIKVQDDIEHRTERALAALDMFVLDQKDFGDIEDVLDKLESYVQSVRKAHPDIDQQTPRQKATTIATYLREQKWIGLDNENRYYSLDNMFLGVALFSSHHNSSPLLSSVIYCYVCRQFDLRAQPCSFPVHVHSVIQPPEGMDLDGNIVSDSDPDPSPDPDLDPQRLYLDPFNTAQPVALSTLRQHLQFLGARFAEEELRFALEPASHHALVSRSATNIINSITRHNPQHTYQIDIEAANYAARFALAMFPTSTDLVRSNLKELTQTFLHNFEADIHIFRSHIMPLTSRLPDHLAYRNLSAQLLQCELERPTPKRRPNTHTRPAQNMLAYKVGQVFRHRRAGYLAVIYGWDTTCEMSSQWITFNNVDGLPKGRDQPFYNAFVADDNSTRYVAQENVMLLGPVARGGTGETVTDADVKSFGIQVGKWFRRFDFDAGAFVSNVKEEYPED